MNFYCGSDRSGTGRASLKDSVPGDIAMQPVDADFKEKPSKKRDKSKTAAGHAAHWEAGDRSGNDNNGQDEFAGRPLYSSPTVTS